MDANQGRKRLVLLYCLWHLWEEAKPGADAKSTESQSLLAPPPWHPPCTLLSYSSTSAILTQTPQLTSLPLYLIFLHLLSPLIHHWPSLTVPLLCLETLEGFSFTWHSEPFMVWPHYLSSLICSSLVQKTSLPGQALSHPQRTPQAPFLSASLLSLLPTMAFPQLCTENLPLFQGPA